MHAAGDWPGTLYRSAVACRSSAWVRRRLPLTTSRLDCVASARASAPLQRFTSRRPQSAQFRSEPTAEPLHVRNFCSISSKDSSEGVVGSSCTSCQSCTAHTCHPMMLQSTTLPLAQEFRFCEPTFQASSLPVTCSQLVAEWICHKAFHNNKFC